MILSFGFIVFSHGMPPLFDCPRKIAAGDAPLHDEEEDDHRQGEEDRGGHLRPHVHTPGVEKEASHTGKV